jgi:outer membrane protein assembly factor BamB
VSRYLLSLLCLALSASAAQNWPQGPGPNFDFTAPAADLPDAWSVALDQNIAWRVPLPETGQSTPVIWGDRIFLSTMKPAGGEASIGKDIVAYCFAAKDGSLLWKREISGSYQTRLSGPFGDASSPAPVTDGQSVWFLNPTGKLVCFDLDGNPRWSKAVTSVNRTRPVLFEGKIIFHRQVYLPTAEGKFGHENKNAGLEKWTQLQALDAATGEPAWLSSCGVNMGCVPLVQRLQDGSTVLVVGRGGGHGPPEKPTGVSMIRADNGETLWSLELAGFMSTQTYPIVDDQALIFHKGEHLWVDAKSGTISRRASIVDAVPVRRHTASRRKTLTEKLGGKKPRSITQQSNLRVGNYHYFRSYTANYLGRVNIQTGAVSYLELPLQVLREPGKPEQTLWPKAGTKKSIAATIRQNSVRNSQGFQVMGDARAVQNGWGHSASPLPSACGNRLYVPILCGMVFVIQADAPSLDESAVLSISDLGPLGEAFTRASISTDGSRLYGHTIRELIAIQAQ